MHTISMDSANNVEIPVLEDGTISHEMQITLGNFSELHFVRTNPLSLPFRPKTEIANV